LKIQALYAKVRSQEEEIHSLQERIAAACLKVYTIMRTWCSLIWIFLINLRVKLHLLVTGYAAAEW